MLVDTSTVPVRHGWTGGFLENHVGGQMKLSPDAIKDGSGGSNRVDKLIKSCEGKHAKEKMFSLGPPYF